MQVLKLKVLFLISFCCLLSFSNNAQTPAQIDSMELEKFFEMISFGNPFDGDSPQLVKDVVSYSQNFIGVPYRYGGTTPAGFDCSGFINYVMGNFGFVLTRTSYGLAEFGENVLLSEIRPGDLLFFKGRNVNSTGVGHVGLVIESTEEGIKFIHASTSRGVVIDNFNTSRYYIPRFIKAKRLDYGVEEIEDLMIDDSMKED